ncbi:hypothetical protein IWZ03DRAFT_42857 [Phyllosticta citriasiana]|uniref:Secreted protein n=1 Tax=Phyllosticta citriasiana TaxID=595635 RepID=A0ABR1KET8_9PEZI
MCVCVCVYFYPWLALLLLLLLLLLLDPWTRTRSAMWLSEVTTGMRCDMMDERRGDCKQASDAVSCFSCRLGSSSGKAIRQPATSCTEVMTSVGACGRAGSVSPSGAEDRPMENNQRRVDKGGGQ